MSAALRSQLEQLIAQWELRCQSWSGVDALGEKAELERCIEQLRQRLPLAQAVPVGPSPRSCNHHSDCAAVDRKHPGGGHCHDPECEASAPEFCDNVCQGPSSPWPSQPSPGPQRELGTCPLCQAPGRSRLRRTTPAGDDWALLRMAELRQQGEKARFRVNWATVRGNRFLWLSIRRADGSLESRPRPDDYVDEGT